MSKITQYSSFERQAVDYLGKYGFSYDLEDLDIGVTSVNRVRKFLQDFYEISAISKNLIFGLITESGGKILGDGLDTNSNTCTLVLINLNLFKQRVINALINGEIRKY